MLSSLLPVAVSDSDQDGLFPTLSFRDRVIGWLSCYVAGLFISILSFGSFSQLILGRPFKFAILYSLGNSIALLSTSFLVGFRAQWRNMINPTRQITSFVYLSSLVSTLILCLKFPEFKWAILTSVIVQWLSLFWYSMSYIPFGQSLARRAALTIVRA